MKTTRRHFLQVLAGGLLLGRATAWAAPGVTDGRLIVVLLRGGLDGLHVFSPMADPRFAELRPGLAQAVAEHGLALAGSGFVAHPAATVLADMYAGGELLFSPCAGTTDLSRSHFQAQDVFELGNGALHGASGFMARAAAELGGGLGSISFTREIPLVFQGGARMPEVAPLDGLGRLPAGRLLDAVRQAHEGLPTGLALEQELLTEAGVAGALADGAMDANAARGAQPAGGFPRLARDLGRVLRGNPRYALAFVDIGGFDTHANQEAILSRAVGALADGLQLLRSELGETEWQRTRIVVSSEFGRTARENGTRGTDHGHGGLALVLGGSVAGGRLLGDFPGLAEASLFQARDLPVLVDWRDLLAATLHDSLGLSEAALGRIFPGRPRQHWRT